jgi:phage/plasmid primase-like uncharacterized protein
MSNINHATALSIIRGLGGDERTGMCLCPAHDDHDPSLFVNLKKTTRKGDPIFRCRSKCSQDAVINALKQRGLWGKSKSSPQPPPRPASDYDMSAKQEDAMRFRKAYGILRAALYAKEKGPIADYFLGRGIAVAPVNAMYLPASDAQRLTGKRFPAIVFPICDDGKLVAAQVTFLTMDSRSNLKDGKGKNVRRTFGPLKGGHVQLGESDPGKPLIVSEGIENGLTVSQLTGFPAIATLGATNMPEISPPQCSELIIAADNNDAGQEAAKALRDVLMEWGRPVRIATPHEHKDWNDALVDANGDKTRIAELRRMVLEAKEYSMKQSNDDRIDALAKMDDPIEFDLACKKLAKELKCSLSAVKQSAAEHRAKSRQTVPAKADIKKLRESAGFIIESKNVLKLFAEDISYVIAGEQHNMKMFYLVGTSRLFETPMSAAFKGHSSTGKSKGREMALEYMPPESVITFTALSDKALIYMPEQLSHKILSMGEAMDEKESAFVDYMIRELISSGKISYPVTQKDPVTNEMVTVTIVKEGPVTFLVTTTKNKLHPENETRLLTLNADDSEAQTQAVMVAVAEAVGLNRTIDKKHFIPWHDFQRWLAAGNLDVFVPFAVTLAKMIPAKATRMRRDIKQLLIAIKAHALLHRNHRNVSSKGAIVATIDDDYEPVRALMTDLLAEGSELKVHKSVMETIEAVDAVAEEKADAWDKLRKSNPNAGGAVVRDIAKILKIDRSGAQRRLRVAIDAGYMVNLETRRGYQGRYETIGGKPFDGVVLPTADDLYDKHQEATTAKAEAAKAKSVTRHEAGSRRAKQ